MAKQIRGVYEKNGYWYARISGKEVYCGKGAERARNRGGCKWWDSLKRVDPSPL